MKKKIKVMIGCVYMVAFVGLAGYSYMQYENFSRETVVLEKQKIAMETEKEELERQISDVEQQKENLENQMEDEQSVINNYENVLLGLDDYQKQVDVVRNNDLELLTFNPLPLRYNFDQGVTAGNQEFETMGNAMKTFLPGIFFKGYAAQVEIENNENTDAMIDINNHVMRLLSDNTQYVNEAIAELNANLEVYQSFLNAEDLKERFVNLQVLNEVTKDRPIDLEVLDESRQKLLKELRNYYIRLDCAYEIYAMFLTDNAENRSFLEEIDSKEMEIFGLCGAYEMSMEYSDDELLELGVLDTAKLIQDIMLRIEDGTVRMPAFPIANQGGHTYSRSLSNGGGARMRHIYKDMEVSEKKLLALSDSRNLYGQEEKKTNGYAIYDIFGKPIYIAIDDEYDYFYNGRLLEGYLPQDPDELYERAIWLYERYPAEKGDDEYLDNLLTTM